MSHQSRNHVRTPETQTDDLQLRSGLEALQSSPEFDGPVEALDGHESNDHLTLIYENQAEQFASVVPFVRQGLERDERCMYVADDNSKEDVLAALRDGGVDVDAALESGDLTIWTKRDTYLRNGSFDPDEMIAFLSDLIDDALESHEGFRVAGEMTWILDSEPDVETFLEYEGKLNRLFPETDSLALCQYNRNQFSPEILRDVIRTHPHVIYQNTVCQNVYYTPPEEFFGPEQPEREIDRMMEMLVDRSETKATLQERERYQRKFNDVASDPNRSFDEKLREVFELGCERFGLELGAMARLDPTTDTFEVEAVSDDHDHLEPGAHVTLSETYCRVVDDGGTVSSESATADPVGNGGEGATSGEAFGVNAYLGTRLDIAGGLDRIFFFVSAEEREETFSDEAHTFQQSMGQWVKHELEREQRENRLAALDELSRELMNREGADDVTEYVVDATDEALKLPVTAVALFDEQEGRLRPAAATDDAQELLSETSVLDDGDGDGWQALVTNETRRTTDPLNGENSVLDPPLTELAVLPLSTHGVLVTGTTACGGFDPATFDFVETVASNTEAALDRADREQRLSDREQTLETQNMKLERLNRVNTIIRNIHQALVSASTREEIRQVVCDQLAGVGPYEFAWVGEHDVHNDEVVAHQRAGAEQRYLEEVTVTTDDSRLGQSPVSRAIETREPQVINNILNDDSFEPWRQAAINRGYHAYISLPLRYEDTLYGVLNVYAGQPGVFDDLEQSVLMELSNNIAHSINAVESKKALMSDEVTELEFAVDDPAFESTPVVREIDCEFTLENLVPRSNGSLRSFFSVRGSSPEELHEFVPQLPVADVTLVSKSDGGADLYEVDLDDDSLPEIVLDHGGTVHELNIMADTATVTVHLATDAETREFVEMFQRKYPGANLVAQRVRDRPHQTFTDLQTKLSEDLTARQFETLQTAYFSGYFERPRVRTGSEIADTMDISQPTFNTHLRDAQRKLCERLLETESFGIEDG